MPIAITFLRGVGRIPVRGQRAWMGPTKETMRSVSLWQGLELKVRSATIVRTCEKDRADAGAGVMDSRSGMEAVGTDTRLACEIGGAVTEAAAATEAYIAGGMVVMAMVLEWVVLMYGKALLLEV